ncbi:neocarzinostatin apoprotein domain-containing protein [Nonomuraea sp. NPDC059194]|uniref:neocarzinostatin apoprotein domain-containing protein n=1 Tax=Nonomuraea sp. NPDC059194 TaxID=3346764 RepID=UPI0036A10D31
MPRKLLSWTAALVFGLALWPSPAAAGAQPELTASQSADLSSGSEITVTGTGFAPKTALFLAICDTRQPPGKACDTGNFARVTTDADGRLEAKVKPVATFGATDCTATACALMTNDSANPRDTRNYAQLPITFQAAQATPSTAPSSPAATQQPATQQPAAQQPAASPAAAAEEESGSNTMLVVVLGIAAVLLITGMVVLVRRRRTA